MSIDKILVTIGGIITIAFIYWFFLMKKEQAVTATDAITIIVKGGYSPDIITIPHGKKTTINFLRQDPSSCLEEVVLSDFKIRKYLPMNKEVSITITPQKKGTYQFSCGMNMFHGKLIVT